MRSPRNTAAPPTAPPATPPDRKPPRENPPEAPPATGINFATHAGDEATITTAINETVTRNSVSIGFWLQPSTVAEYAADNFMATHKKNKITGFAINADRKNAPTRFKRSLPFLDVAKPHITPSATALKYAVTS